MTAPDGLPLHALAEDNLAPASPDLLRAMVKTFADALMSAEADALCNAEYGQVSDERVNHRNGYRPREWETRAGTDELAVPKLRQGSYFPHWLLERRRRAEQALISVVATAYLLGVSTRRVEKLAESLGVTQLSKSQVSAMAKHLDEQVAAFRNRPLDAGPYSFVSVDALTQKVREGGRIINVHALIAVGVNADGHREILGLDVATAKDGAGWLAFLRSLIARGLPGVQLVISDAHAGLVDAIGAILPGASWQRCRTHYARNLLSQVPKSAQPWVTTLLRTVFEQPDTDAVHAQMRRVLDALEAKFPKAAAHLDAAQHDLLAFTAFPREIWRQSWSNNPQKRLNKEIRRRTDVVGIFPDRTAVIRLVGAVLAEQNDEWTEARRYMGRELLARCREITATVRDLEEERYERTNHAHLSRRRPEFMPTHPEATDIDRLTCVRGRPWVLLRFPRYRSYDPSPGRYAGRAWEGVGMRELERITARRSELDTLAEELVKQLQEVQAEREELVIAERVLNRLAVQDRAAAGGRRDRRPSSRPGGGAGGTADPAPQRDPRRGRPAR
ncbi:hypothetical protein GCM10009535_33650 [Streptomyces thermocarboxydovorans]|uniref:Transposase n=1 Tax=Streptomyces thermocarboxydovorans TaxID=59298 RepID=A0ABN1HIP1_9ACTN